MAAYLGFALILIAIVAVLFILAVVEAAALDIKQRNRATLLEFHPKTDTQPDASIESRRAA